MDIKHTEGCRSPRGLAPPPTPPPLLLNPTNAPDMQYNVLPLQMRSYPLTSKRFHIIKEEEGGEEWTIHLSFVPASLAGLFLHSLQLLWRVLTSLISRVKASVTLHLVPMLGRKHNYKRFF